MCYSVRKIIVIALFALALMGSGFSATPNQKEENSKLVDAPEATAEGVPVPELCLFLYDACGGCGVDSPGCGNCEEMIRYHGILKKQLGDALYDGGLRYSMINYRYLGSDELYARYYEDYKVYEDLYGVLPIVFLGYPDDGVFIWGEPGLSIVGEMVQLYKDDTPSAELQTHVDTLLLQAEKAEVQS